MFTSVIPQKTQKTLELLGSGNLLANFYLSGGTACALHLGHRISEDLDFFIWQSVPLAITSGKQRWHHLVKQPHKNLVLYHIICM